MRARESGRFKGHLKRGMEVRWVEDRRARGEPASPVSPSMNIWCKGLKPAPWTLKKCDSWKRSEESGLQQPSRSKTQGELPLRETSEEGGGGRGRESTRECVEAWQGRQTGNLYIHTHVCIIREMLEKSELDVRGTHVQAYMDPIWEYNLILMFKTSQVNPVLSFFSSSNLQIFP